MNYSMISYILGWIFNFEAAFMILPGITAIIYREKNGLAFLITMLICLTIGIPLTRRKRKKQSIPCQRGCCYSCSQLAGTQYCRSPSFYYFRKYSPSYRCNI